MAERQKSARFVLVGSFFSRMKLNLNPMKDERKGGYGNLENSKESRKEQKTQLSGCPEEVWMETRGNQGAHQAETALTNGNSDVQQIYTSNLLEWVLESDNLKRAYEQVVGNKGSHGTDNMTVDQLKPYLKENWEQIKSQLLEGTYKPKAVRRVEIPKADGGIRLLGIPTVLDRMLQQSIAQILNGVFDHTFSEFSYGFRKGRSAHDAIETAREHISEGYKWVVDIDLEKFFDRVNHDKLMSLIARRVGDKRLLKLIRRYLESGIMINGVEVISEEGVAQGGNLSPLLSNIMLNELDKELEKRGHRFVRYADDCNIYVKSKRAGERVYEGIKLYLETKLKLKVNEDKSAVDRPENRKFLGFSFYRGKGGMPRIRIHKRPYQKLKEKVKRATNRNWGVSLEYRLRKLAEITNGWVNYFGIADGVSNLQRLDEWIRRRLRACVWKQWKRVKTRYKNLRKLGISEGKAWEFANTRKGYWRISKSPILSTTITNQRLETKGFKSLVNRYHAVH
jgi:group II intron reverse transcriptase/maturase